VESARADPHIGGRTLNRQKDFIVRRSLRFALPLLAGLGVMAVAAPAAKADYHCGPGWFLYYGRCVPYGYGYGYGGPGISLYWGPTYRHYRHHYDYDDWNRHYGRYHPHGHAHYHYSHAHRGGPHGHAHAHRGGGHGHGHAHRGGGGGHRG
jgi:hypothetical protein